MTANDILLADIYRTNRSATLASKMLELHTASWWLAYFNIWIGE